MKREKIALVVIAVLIVLGTLIGGLYLSQSEKNKKQGGAVQQGDSTAQTPAPSSQEISVKNITIHTGLTDTQLADQDVPYDLKTAKGHYLISMTPDIEKGIKAGLIYDGKEITLDGKILSMGLSLNGLHYAYSIDRGTGDDLYIDGKKVANDIRIEQPRVTDDGQHYFYISQIQRDITSSVWTALKKDGKEIYSYADGILSYQLSSDGKHYLAELRHTVFSADNFGSIASWDGNNIAIVKNIRNGELSLSENGEHYGYVLSSVEGGKEELYVDGKKILESRTLYWLRVANNGGYVVWGPEDKFVYTSKKNIPMKSDSSETGASTVAVNEDMSHFLILDTKWRLDDKEVDVENDGIVELTGTSVFTYKVAK